MALARKQQDFNSKENPYINTIDQFLDDEKNNHTAIGDRITKAMIMDELFGYGPNAIIPKDVESMWSAWCNGQTRWKKFKPTRVAGKVTRGYERILHPGQEPEVISFNMVDSADDPLLKEVKLQALFRRLNREFSFYIGGPFPYEKITTEELEGFENMGYIYNRGLPSKPDYRVAYLA